MKNKLPENNSIRLASLDILRGFDLFLLVFFQPVFVALARQMNMSFLDSILYQFDHEVWEGFRFWDLVMPLFLFMTGASMPLTIEVYRDYGKLLACVSENPEACFSPVYLRNDCSGKPARSGRHASLFVFQYIAVYCCRLSYCCGHSVALPVQVAGRDNVATPSRLLGSDDVFGGFHTGGELCGTSGQMRFRAIP